MMYEIETSVIRTVHYSKWATSNNWSKGLDSLFVCFYTRVVHSETVENVSSKVFVSVLKRFMGRREPKPSSPSGSLKHIIVPSRGMFKLAATHTNAQ